MAYKQTIKTLLDQGCAVRGVEVRCLEMFNVARGRVECIRLDGLVLVKGRDLFGQRIWLTTPENCEVIRP